LNSPRAPMPRRSLEAAAGAHARRDRSPRTAGGRARAGAFALALLLGLLPAAARAVPLRNADCMTCHAQRDLARESGGSVFVDLARLQASPHSRLACVTCHRGIRELPHETHLALVECASCHRDASAALAGSAHDGSAGVAKGNCLGCHGAGHDVRRPRKTGVEGCASCHAAETAQYRESVHGRAFANGDHEASTCKDCHGPFHSIRAAADSTSPVNRANLPRTCAHCHADRALMTRRHITIPQAYELYTRSVHGRSKDPKAATCSDCHETHALLRANDPASSIFRTNVPHTCGRCHEDEYAAFETSIHGQALRRGVSDAPNCTDCHGEHLTRGPHDDSSPVMAGEINATCSKCHEAQGIRETYGLPAGRLNSYRDSYHGLASRAGSRAVANCASCHGFHDVLPSTDPRSAVSPARLAVTCGKCHPGAGNWAELGPVHVVLADSKNPILYWARVSYLWLILVVCGGMAVHQGLDFARKMRRHYRHYRGEARAESCNGRWFPRLARFERIQHVLLMVSFFTLVWTGFALKFPEAWPFAWMAHLEGSSHLRSQVHRVAAVVMIGTSLMHLGYLFTQRGRGLIFDLLPRLSDVRGAYQNVFYLVGLRREPPLFERFNYIEKAEYWALVWGTLVMTVTGILLWFENQSLRWLPKWAFDLATLVHYYEAWLAFVAIVIWHLYQNILNPDVYPMNWGWVTGLISEEQLRHEHGAMWARIEAEEAEQATREAGGETGAP
jgi:formate dehydrogenase gamma subunit